MEKRTLLALALSFLVLGFYPVILQKFYPSYNKKSPVALTSTATGTISKPGSVQKLINGEPLTAGDDLPFRDCFSALHRF